MTLEAVRDYPETRKVGTRDVTLRYMEPEDREAILAFARALPEHDLLFLRRDITKEPAVESWIRDIKSGLITTVLALAGDRIVGYGTIHRNDLRWSTHVAELRVMVAEEMRGQGLGHILTQEAFAIALASGIEKIEARMTLDQKGAIATFEGIGFRPEALLRDQVKDGAGKKHDMLILTHEVSRFRAAMDAYGVSEAFGF